MDMQLQQPGNRFYRGFANHAWRAWLLLPALLLTTFLTFIYPRWEINPSAWEQYVYPAGAVVLIAGLWLMRKRSRAPLAALLFFGV